MADKFLSARVPEDLKRRVKTIATQQDKSVQDFLGEIVISYLDNQQQFVPSYALPIVQQNVINLWLAALQENDEAAKSVFRLMEIWSEIWQKKGIGQNQG